MSIWDGISIKQLIDTYSISNTASFLYFQFRKDATVSGLAAKYTPQELVNSLEEVLADKSSIENIVKAYICLVALSFFGYSTIAGMINFLDLGKLRWGYYILGIIEQSYVPTSYISAIQDIFVISGNDSGGNTLAATDIKTIPGPTDD